MTDIFKDSLKSGDTLTFQKELAKLLADKLQQQVTKLSEEVDPESAASLKVEMAVKSFGGGDYVYHTGVAITRLRSKQAALEFIDWLEECNVVDTYEMHVIHTTADVDIEDDVDIESITDDQNFEFEFSIYFVPEVVSFNNFEYDEEESGQVTELTHKVKVSFLGTKVSKVKCGHGFKFNNAMNTCQKISGDALISLRKAVRKAIITKKGEGAMLKKRIKLRTKKAMKFRKAFGLRV